MCGIIGCVGSMSEQTIRELTNTIKHRGPDNSGIFLDHSIALGHTRLSILDLSCNGDQPMESSDHRYVIIFNGEIYNHLELRKKLEGKYSFTSTSDTETLLYGFIEYGPEVLNQLNGIFAFAVYDKTTGDLTVARDQFGVKPLYYYQDASIFLFGSEIKSFLGYSGLDTSIEYRSLFAYLTFLWCPGNMTPFAKVKKLLPGHYIRTNIHKQEAVQPQKYYDIPFDGKYSKKSEAELQDELEQLLLNAVERQMLADVPVGFFLSGGLDSSCMVAMARKLYPDKKIQCFTIANDRMQDTEGFSDDLYYARIVARHLGADLEVVQATPNIIKDFDKMVWHLDEPEADPAPLHVLNISKRAREMGYKVLIGGTAGDDIFSGYRRHQALSLEKYFRFIPPSARKLLKSISHSLNTKNPGFRRLRKLTEYLDKDKIARLKFYYSWLPVPITKELFSKEIRTEMEQYNPFLYFDELLKNIPEETNDLNKMLYWEIRTFLADHNLNYTDKMSMATGVEVRVPFLDKDLVEFSTKIPPELKMKGRTTKYLLKKVMEKYLPAEVIHRPKAGFGAPVRQWITGELEGKIHEYLNPDAIRARGIFDPDKVWELIRDNKAGKIDASYSVWALLAIESWMRFFADSRRQVDSKQFLSNFEG